MKKYWTILIALIVGLILLLASSANGLIPQKYLVGSFIAINIFVILVIFNIVFLIYIYRKRKVN